MQPALTCMIIDDDICSIDLLRHFAERSGQIHLAGTQTNPFQALEVLESRPVDFLLLDVEMPGMNGLELMHQLSSPPKVILCTGYGRFALSGFEIEAIDFLLKPITYPRFLRAIHRLSSTLYRAPDTRRRLEIGDYRYFREVARSAWVKVILSEIILIKAYKNYMQLITLKRTLQIRMSLSELRKV